MIKRKTKDDEIIYILNNVDKGKQPTFNQNNLLRSCTILELRFSNAYEMCNIPNSINLLVNLKTLTIFRNNSPIVPDSIGQLPKLKQLIFYECSFNHLPESIGSLSQLEDLRIYSTPLLDLPDSIGQLTSLTHLTLSGTTISSLPSSISHLSELNHINLSGTKIIELPEWIGTLPKLTHLDLSDMVLHHIPQSLALRGLPFIETDKPLNLGPCINLMYTNLLQQNIAIFLYSPSLIPSLYKSDELNTIRECRTIFLGDGEAGKSYTIQRFRNEGHKETKENPYFTHETPGIEILDYHVNQDPNSFDIHFWDFGGQQLLHSMHRCFLTEDTCYVVMVKTRETKANERARYWLRNVSVFAPNSPVILFVNCWENDDGKRSIDEPRLCNDFPNIKEVIYCSAKEATEKEFQKQVMDSIIQMVASSVGVSKKVPQQWLIIRKAIEEESKKNNYLTSDRYHELCQINNIEKEQIPDLLNFFNSLGVCFSYHLNQSKEEFAEYKLLNPIWLTNGIYAIIEEGRAATREGCIKVEAIQQMLGNAAPQHVNGKDYNRTVPEIIYEANECDYLLAVAEAHELCYRIDQNTLFFPSLCSRDTPKEALLSHPEYPNQIDYQLKYLYLPDNVIHKLMIRCYRKELVIKCCWARGLVIGWNNTHKAIIYMEDDDTVLSVRVFSTHDQPPYTLFQIIREEILEINSTLNLTARENIIDGEDIYSITALISAAKDSDKVYGSITGKAMQASKLLGRFYDEWTIKLMTVKDGVITIPILPIEYHRCSPRNDTLRQALYEAYHKTCAYCGNRIASLREMQVEHIFPREYKSQEQLQEYINYLNARGFDIDHPDYVENYLPVHGPCNLDKSNYVEPFALLARHERAAKNTPRVLKLKEQYEAKKD